MITINVLATHQPFILLSFYLPWEGKMSISQRAVMLCSWGVKADISCLQVKLCVAISEHFRKSISYLKALYKCSGLLFLYSFIHALVASKHCTVSYQLASTQESAYHVDELSSVDTGN